MRRRYSFSKLLLGTESLIVLYTTREGFALARLAIEQNYLGALGWVTAMVGAAWGAYGTSAAFYYNKAKAENTAGGLVYELTCGADGTQRQDCE